jgi:NAD(P)-dependent dehydrogenase (short-subunit alcohol dehydrogenase family)
MRITFFIDLICQNQHFGCWLTDKVAIVTGGNGGIGLGMARGLAQAGAELMIVGRDQKKSSAAVKELAAIGVKAAPGAADLTDEAARRSVVARTVAKFGHLDILVNNAGIASRTNALFDSSVVFAIFVFTLCVIVSEGFAVAAFAP